MSSVWNVELKLFISIFNIPSVSFLTPFLCDNVCLNRRKVAFNHSFTKFRIYKRRMREFFLLLAWILLVCHRILQPKTFIILTYHKLRNKIEKLKKKNLKKCKLATRLVVCKINKTITTQKTLLFRIYNQKHNWSEFLSISRLIYGKGFIFIYVIYITSQQKSPLF